MMINTRCSNILNKKMIAQVNKIPSNNIELKIFNNFLGKWETHKTVDKKLFFKGNCLFKKYKSDNNLFLYKEKGLIYVDRHIDGETREAYRNYFYLYDNGIKVFFYEIFNEANEPSNNDNNNKTDIKGQKNSAKISNKIKLFHTLQFEINDKKKEFPFYATGLYLCPPDTYDVKYTFNNYNNFDIEYKVKGPKKDYTIKTNFSKITQTSLQN